MHSPPPVLSAEVEELEKVVAKKKAGAEHLQLVETASVITVSTLGGKGSWSQVCRWQDQITWW